MCCKYSGSKLGRQCHQLPDIWQQISTGILPIICLYYHCCYYYRFRVHSCRLDVISCKRHMICHILASIGSINRLMPDRDKPILTNHQIALYSGLGYIHNMIQWTHTGQWVRSNQYLTWPWEAKDSQPWLAPTHLIISQQLQVSWLWQ